MKQIGRYTIRGLLGRGGMGRVYKVELHPIGKISALKNLAPDPLLAKLMGYDRIQALFVAEASTIAGLNHPNIIRIHDFDENEGTPFYVMDYYADNIGAMIGESYQTETPSRKINPDKALDYTHQTLKGLACLHEAGIIHRDIKPFNLLIDASGTVKICDFGLSKLRGETYSGPPNLNMGSPYYAAPEQENDPDSIDPTADLYPVGVMLFRMLTGQLPEHPPDTKGYHPISQQHPDLDDVWDEFIYGAMAKNPSNRFSSASKMLTALKKLKKHWDTVKKNTCRIPQHTHNHPTCLSPKGGALSLREDGIKAPPQKARGRFGLDPLWRPVTYYQNDLIRESQDTLLDRTNSLLWQTSGSMAPCDWYRAQSYITWLNEIRFGRRTTWRLPTIPELVTLLRPTLQARDLCMEPLFDPEQTRLWSIDRRSFAAAYYVDAELGFVGWQDFSAPYYVRAVCSI